MPEFGFVFARGGDVQIGRRHAQVVVCPAVFQHQALLFFKGKPCTVVSVVAVKQQRFYVVCGNTFARRGCPFEACCFGSFSVLLCGRGGFACTLVLADVDDVVADVLPVNAGFAVLATEEKGDFFGLAVVVVGVEEALAADVDAAVTLVFELARACAIAADAVLAVVVEREGIFHAAVKLHRTLVVTKGEVAAGSEAIHLEGLHKFFAVINAALDGRCTAAARAAGDYGGGATATGGGGISGGDADRGGRGTTALAFHIQPGDDGLRIVLITLWSSAASSSERSWTRRILPSPAGKAVKLMCSGLPCTSTR